MTIILNPWISPTKAARIDPPVFDTERERWIALLEDPTALLEDPLSYGPLSVEGYFEIRRENEFKRHHSWPQDAKTIAALMKACGVDRFDAPYAAMEHASVLDLNSTTGIAKLFNIHLAILKELDIEPSLSELVYLTEYCDWGDSYFEEFLNGFDVMLRYLPTKEDETAFLQSYLPQLKPSRFAVGNTESVGLALASSFTRADVDLIIEWCRNNDDQVGLGYLVWQDRFPFSAWLFECARPTKVVPNRRGMRPDPVNDIKLRRDEQLETLQLLSKRVHSTQLQEQGALFRQQYPELLDELLERNADNPSSDEKIRWAFGLYQAHVIPAQYPALQQWLDKAYAEQQDLIDKRTLDRHERDNKHSVLFSEKMHYVCGPAAVPMGDTARTLLARDIALRVDVKDVGRYLTQMPDTTWLKNISVAPMILSRNDADTQGPNLLAAFYPFMPLLEKIEVARKLVHHANKKQVNIDSAAAIMSSLDSEKYRAGITSFHEGTARMAHLLTGVNPDSLFESLTSLEIRKTDAIYIEMIEQWVVKQLTEQAPVVSVPQDLGDNILGL